MRKLYLTSVVLFTIGAVIVGFWWGRFQRIPREQSDLIKSGQVRLSAEDFTKRKAWADSVKEKYKYEVGSYSGVLPVVDSDTEIWILGRKIGTKVGQYDQVGLENNYGKTFMIISDRILYTSQKGDDLHRGLIENIDPRIILLGDLIALRATMLDDRLIGLEMRQLTR